MPGVFGGLDDLGAGSGVDLGVGRLGGLLHGLGLVILGVDDARRDVHQRVSGADVLALLHIYVAHAAGQLA